MLLIYFEELQWLWRGLEVASEGARLGERVSIGAGTALNSCSVSVETTDS